MRERGSILGKSATLLAACSSPTSPPGAGTEPSAAWLDTGVCYEIFVRSFKDSDGDGIGDLEGLIQKLDYVNDGDPATTADLGANCIWLMPVAESPSYHGYDVTDYYRQADSEATSQDNEATEPLTEENTGE